MNIVITDGGTSEAIDKVRKITNMSKGTLGKQIAFEMGYQKEIEKIYFLSPISVEMKRDMNHYAFPGKVECIQTTSVKNVYDQLQELLSNTSPFPVISFIETAFVVSSTLSKCLLDSILHPLSK